ncbi:GNAT family N-acetyltransferase [Streptomyces diastaticus]|uniref:Acetyltransferase n=3 Tax=Streptomyces TaxID=1883 RepID=A0A380NCS8_STRGR|nr:MULTISPECIES: GNAT family N-acetyltransferase [Streptomyces]NEE26443.1 GNAT family N-acetyltransferase [Streptomyces sp. SID7982]PJM85475.1 GNAT family N-acetyltransferase [Streptomyces sp. TSRI0384-2]QNE80669.1 GNAT family N-acetyltransferase [Streptomyces rutgersensis]RPK93278.1 Mycothiol acetyltransferase [Streptomyces sp. ADI98-12]WPR50678.1 GNAT family N-acetyltransferase [Streptomyces sp. S399]
MKQYVRPGGPVRPVRADEWRQVKELRLSALKDPVAHLAFLETYERAAAAPDSVWRERAESAAAGTRVRQFVTEGPDGTWSGTVTVRLEEPGSADMFGGTVSRRQAHLVGVFVRPECRGSGVIDTLFDAALTWAWSLAGVSRARLYVHEDNARAERFYRRFGFVPSGQTVPMKGDPAKVEREMVLGPPGASPGRS